jgi:signal transduction histidine kinase
MERAQESTPERSTARRLLRFVCALLLFLAFGYVGRATIIDHEAVNLVGPAGGIAALWLASGSRQTWPGDLLALAVATLTVNLTTGATIPSAAAFTVSNLLQVCLYVALARRWTEDVWGLGGQVALHRLVDLGRLVAAAVTASFVGASVGAVGIWLTVGPGEISNLLVWWGRNTVTLVVITILGLLAGPAVFAARGARDLARTVYESLQARSVARLVETELLVGCSIGLYALLFGQRGGAPLSFLVLAVSFWAGLRFTPLAVMAHGMAMGAAGLVFTLNGTGPFADIESAHVRALVAQLFVATTVLTGLALAFSREERDSANRRLARARRQADQRAQVLGAVLESMNEGLVVVEDGGRILVSNAASSALLGVEDLGERVGPVTEPRLFHADGTPLTDDEMPATRALAGEEVPPQDFHLRTDSVPEGRVLEISARPVQPVDAADVPMAMVNIRDVTLDRQHRDALASFAGVVAHDLFNPLTIVTGWAEALEEEFGEGSVSPATGLPMVARVHEAATHMRDVIGDLLAYTVARDQSVRAGVVDLTEELRSLALLRIDGPGNPLITVAPDLRAWADTGLLRQLFDNLLGNAVKYVAPGVRPRVDIRGRRDGDWLEVRVTDNGIGIPAEQRDLVFETFHRAHDTGYQGTGLGLAICRRIADRHGGSIHAEAGPGGIGTTFVIRLPATPAGFAAGRNRTRQAPVEPTTPQFQRRAIQRQPLDEQAY